MLGGGEYPKDFSLVVPGGDDGLNSTLLVWLTLVLGTSPGVIDVGWTFSFSWLESSETSLFIGDDFVVGTTAASSSLRGVNLLASINICCNSSLISEYFGDANGDDVTFRCCRCC